LWINLDPDCEPLRQYLQPAAALLAPFQLDQMSYRWRRWVVFDCNWKIAMEAFSETYHLPGTHPQVMKFASYRSWSREQGKHSHIGYQPAGDIETTNTKVRVGKGDPRISTAEMHAYLLEAVNAITTQTLTEMARRLPDELPPGTPPDKVVEHWLRSAREHDAARGVIWPVVTPEQLARAGNAWQIFPNFQVGHALTHALCYSARPYGYDPNKCIFETSVLELYPAGGAPKTEWIHTPAEDEAAWGEIPPQDFSNMAALQQGVADPGFRGVLPNPLQERSVTHLHRMLANYMGEGEPQKLG
jgi:phenylpropionate dioxygenase-like ring-hydroxylating dioxygenase large terminal subunit